ncbi:MAG: hypothetical protein RSA50_06090, partial [Mucinivorans sp.]
MKQILTLAVISLMAVGCCGSPKTAQTKTDSTTMTQKAPFQTKYTNADYYKDGVFQVDVAKKAYLEMFQHFNYPMTPFLEANWWVADFGLGDFENCGMGGVFYVNDSVNGYFAHDIYLLPGQMIPEHKHVKTKFPAKVESWMVREGWAYNFSEIGEPTEGYEALIAQSQKATTVSKNFVKQEQGAIVNLADKGVGTFHF